MKMKMYKNNETYYPMERFFNMNFDRIKKYIANCNYLFKDYGSLILIKNSEIAISINHVGKAVFFYDNIEESKKNMYISMIEDIFKNEVQEFKFMRNN
ncbi:hypothetical protein GOQ29_01105 [Clostridium sp. D2Q-14]|uniref:hypothetical protein n=1 Tax=Anaeromonas gelatinilytica TaxID=2683194 RepID=UPI00193C1539|nr:hypothetical protein [Anaeromonas gelatinilytica]MBS4534209.1 hypothetical protein [Anaeromonas gelatinilytica]